MHVPPGRHCGLLGVVGRCYTIAQSKLYILKFKQKQQQKYKQKEILVQ